MAKKTAKKLIVSMDTFTQRRNVMIEKDENYVEDFGLMYSFRHTFCASTIKYVVMKKLYSMKMRHYFLTDPRHMVFLL